MTNKQALERWNRVFRRLVLPALIAAASATLGIWLVASNERLNRLEQVLTVERQGYLPPADVKPIVIVAVDDDTVHNLKKPGARGIPRTRYAQLLEGLQKAGARQVLIDVFFQDPIKEEDEKFYKALLQCGEGDPALPVVLLEDDLTPVEDARSPDGRAYSYHAPAPLQGKTIQNIWLGNPNALYIDDVISAAIPLRMNRTTQKPSMYVSFAAVLQYLHLHPSTIRSEPGRIIVDPLSWELGANSQIMASWTPKIRQFPEIELTKALKMLEGGTRSDLFKDKLVIVGVTAGGVDDYQPIGQFGNVPAVYFVAQMVNTLLQPELNRPTTFPLWANWALGLFLSFSAAWGLISLRLGFGLAVAGAMLVAAWFGPLTAANYGVVTLYVPPVLSVIMAICVGALAAVLVGQFKDVRPAGFAEECTVLFVDLENSTSLTETLGAAGYESLHTKLNQRWHRLVVTHRGDIERTTGDGFMALFRASRNPDHAASGVRCAQAIVHPAFSDTDVTVRAGVETGTLSGGYVFEGGRKAWSSAGKAVILAQRLQSVAGNLGVTVVLGPVIAQLVDGTFQIEDLGCHELKGFERGVTVFAVKSGRTLEGESEGEN